MNQPPLRLPFLEPSSAGMGVHTVSVQSTASRCVAMPASQCGAGDLGETSLGGGRPPPGNAGP